MSGGDHGSEGVEAGAAEDGVVSRRRGYNNEAGIDCGCSGGCAILLKCQLGFQDSFGGRTGPCEADKWFLEGLQGAKRDAQMLKCVEIQDI